ncbi:MAG TPA: UDP-2,4-diacetamido-2,4,6-trideoxy-beta-L-altropyranose hydrolase [Steroidobacteraceae bacterium]|nr:UDP-2,4-diacetamido-2,4,6-trideoxy-beta-L-altropyranose hydrolase [Steroidobacteraceae bacterium]
MSVSVLIRTDASLQIGTGHVMRCLVLADALREHGAATRFVCREHSGNLIELIRQRGHEARVLTLSGHEDAQQTKAHIGDASVDWLIVDHYALDAQWETSLRPHCRRLMVIDDLADRRHDCDLLLDQTLGRLAADYAGLVPGDCEVLIGPAYALLRPEFAAMRPPSLARREQSQLRHILITMGGVDMDNVTSKVLEALRTCALPPDCRISVVMGATAPHLEAVRENSRNMPWPTLVLSNVQDMATLLAESDLAIGAAGTSSWERCCLGVPSLIAVLAENQQETAAALEGAGAAIGVGDATRPDFGSAIVTTVNRVVAEPAALGRMSANARTVTQGGGAQRVAEAMTSSYGRTVVRPLEQRDLNLVLSWRNHPEVRDYMLTQHEISADEHATWFERASRDPSRCLLIVEEAGAPLGFVQFSGVGSGASEWGFYAAPGAPRGTGRKLGQAALDYAFGPLQLQRVCGQALSHNAASIRFHESLGFSREGVRQQQPLANEPSHAMVCFGLAREQWLSRAKG